MVKSVKRSALLGMLMGLITIGTASAQNVVNIGDPTPGQQEADLIAVSTTFTSDNVYNLQDQIFVMPGATLTIEAGTRIASTPTENGSGSLAVARGGKIMVLGTQNNPVVMTSANDDGTWREAANEWGNLTIMGNALISASDFDGQPLSVNNGGNIRQNTKIPDGLNERQMEGLVAGFEGDSKVLFGGNDDDDDSGTISYLSIRFGGRVLGLGNELNGLSLGGIGRGTDIDHVEVMNNVDDGIEIWGGTVNLKYISIWNIGDDSFDIDEGWRGKAQFVLIVQGYSLDAPQGSGVGDNCFETDGAEDSDAQPVTTASIYNCTVIGQPLDGDRGTAWRDGARVQYHNCIFMDIGEELVGNDGDDKDGAHGYGFNGTLTFDQVWATPYTHSFDVAATINAAPGAQSGDFNYPTTLYQAQVDGNLAEIRDSIMFSNLADNAYTEAELRGVFEAANNNLREPLNSPIKGITRADTVVKGGKAMQRVILLDPRAANDATTHMVTPAPDDGFFTPVTYVGAFSENVNWLIGWTAADEFGMLVRTAVPGDVNEDGMVTPADALCVFQRFLGIPSCLDEGIVAGLQ